MTRAFPPATALAAALIALATAAAAEPAPVQLAQMNVAPKIQPAPPANLARPPVITPRIDTSRLAGEKDEARKQTDANPERVPQETATDGARAPEIARQSPPPAARFIRAPLPQARPELFGGVDPGNFIDARAATEAREAAEAAAAAGVGVERSGLSGLGDPSVDDQGGGPPDPQLGGMTPEEIEARFGRGGMKSPEDIAHGLATEFNDLGNRGTDSPTGDFADGFRPDLTTIPTGDLASGKSHTLPDGRVQLPPEDDYVATSSTGWVDAGDGGESLTVTKERADGSRVIVMQYRNEEQGRTVYAVRDENAEGEMTSGVYTEVRTGGSGDDTGGGVAELHTPESAPGGGAGCAPSDGSAACQEFRRLMREGNSPGRMIAGGMRVNPGDPDDGTGSGPRIRIGQEDLLGNPDPNSWGRGGAGRGARSFDGGTLINDEGGGTGAGAGQ